MSPDRQSNLTNDPLRRIRIVVVDDIPETVAYLASLLGLDGRFEIIGTASTGQEAIEVISRRQADIILMDVMMPGMDGIAATAIVRNSHPEVKVVMMSVQNGSDYLRRALRAGASDYLVKPFSVDELLDTLLATYDRPAPKADLEWDPEVTGASTAPPISRAARDRERTRIVDASAVPSHEPSGVPQGDGYERTCARCGEVESAHRPFHRFEGARWQHVVRTMQAPVALAVFIVGLYAFWVSANTPDAPFHGLTRALLCFWDVKGTACS